MAFSGVPRGRREAAAGAVEAGEEGGKREKNLKTKTELKKKKCPKTPLFASLLLWAPLLFARPSELESHDASQHALLLSLLGEGCAARRICSGSRRRDQGDLSEQQRQRGHGGDHRSLILLKVSAASPSVVLVFTSRFFSQELARTDYRACEWNEIRDCAELSSKDRSFWSGKQKLNFRNDQADASGISLTSSLFFFSPKQNLGTKKNYFQFKIFSPSPSAPKQPSELPTVVPAPSYRIPVVWLGLNVATALAHVSLGGDSLSSQVPGLLFASALPALLAVQASRVRFVFGPRTLEVVVGTETPEEAAAGQGQETENRFVGGKNEWSYDSFVNWEFFPSKGFPVLVYFKESQTKPEGQIHFFPVLFQAKELYTVMKERCGPSVNSG